MSANVNSKSKLTQAVPFFVVKNIEASLDFYVKGIGFEMTNKWIDGGRLRWCWLQHGGAAMMLQEYVNDDHHKYTLLKDPGEGVSIYFICEDALSIYREVVLKGLSASEPFVGNKMWVTGLIDPDGYEIFFESPTDAPEETKYLNWIKSR